MTSDASAEGAGSFLTAIAALAGAGACLGVSTNMAKVAAAQGIAPLAFLAWSILGASLVLSAVAAARGTLPSISRRSAEYFAVAAFVTVAGSNLIVFSAVPVVGAGFVALVITLPPLLTYAGALAMGMERFDALRALGVLAALAGAAILAAEQLRAPGAPAAWIGLTLLGPVLLAIGNLYRSLRWPPGQSAEALAPGMLGAAALMLFAVGALPGRSVALPSAEAAILGLVGLQALVFSAQFLLLFVLQKAGGPVLLSLLGGVGAVVGVPAAILLLGEDAPGGLGPGAGLIALGIAAVAWGGRRARRGPA